MAFAKWTLYPLVAPGVNQPQAAVAGVSIPSAEALREVCIGAAVSAVSGLTLTEIRADYYVLSFCYNPADKLLAAVKKPEELSNRIQVQLRAQEKRMRKQQQRVQKHQARGR